MSDPDNIDQSEPLDPVDMLRIDANKIQDIDDVRRLLGMLGLSIHKRSPLLPYMLDLVMEEDKKKLT